jgi:hypothetical protein
MPESKGQRKRQDCIIGWWRSRGLTICRCNAGKTTREVPLTAVAIVAQTVAQAAAQTVI